MTEDHGLSRGRARVFFRPVDPREGNTWTEIPGVESVKLAPSESGTNPDLRPNEQTDVEE